jgi:oligopeptide transport system substrate-binding protein
MSHYGQWGLNIDFEGLTRLDDELQVVPGAAESWEFSPDGKTLTFHLREGLVFSDGAPVTAEHFRYAAARLCSPELGSESAMLLFDVIGCEESYSSRDVETGTEEGDASDSATSIPPLGVYARDDRTLEMQFERPAPYFPVQAANWGSIPLRQVDVEAGGPDWWANSETRIGNGPFRLVSLVRDGPESEQRLVYVRNERYWGDAPKLDGIDFLFLDLYAPATIEAYRRGELDMTWPPEEILPVLEADPVLSRELVPIPVPGTIYWEFNHWREPFQDPKVREAFAYAFDRDAYCLQIALGTCKPTLSFIAPGSPGAIETDAFAFDPQKAREALAASSYGGPENLPQVVYYVAEESNGEVRFGEWLSAQYREVLGIELELVNYADDEYDAIYGVEPEAWPQLTEATWFSSPDPRGWFDVWRCGSEFNRGYCNPELDALLDRADAELDPEARIAMYEEAGRLLVADAPALFVRNVSWRVLINPQLTGYSPTTPSEYWPGWESLLTLDIEPAP